MRRFRALSLLLSRDTPWLRWWQELILNWVSTWSSVGLLVVVRPDGLDSVEWSAPSDLDLKRQELEALLALKVDRGG